MRARQWATAVAALSLAGCAVRRVPAQPMRSTLTGVYTPEQAARGEGVYAEVCRSCHSGQAHSESFKRKWNGQPLSKLFDYVSERMPGDSPGSLEHRDYTLVLAYLLRLAGMPAGPRELPGADEALRLIRFDTVETFQGHGDQ